MRYGRVYGRGIFSRVGVLLVLLGGALWSKAMSTDSTLHCSAVNTAY